MSPDFPALRHLLHPLSPEVFFDRHWEQAPLRQLGPTNRFALVLSRADIESLLATRPLPASLVRVVRRGLTVEVPAKEGLVDGADLLDMLRGGATVILNSLQRLVRPLSQLCADLEFEFGHAFQTNVYVTPPGSYGFDVHVDGHDVFVLQVSGTKFWALYPPPDDLPGAQEGGFLNGNKLGPAADEFVLPEGGLLYLPRGVPHGAKSTDEFSIHITLGVLSITWLDWLKVAVEQAAQSHAPLRRSLPPGHHRSPPAGDALPQPVRMLSAVVDPAAVHERLVQQLVETRSPRLDRPVTPPWRSAEELPDLVQLAPRQLTNLTTSGDRIRLAWGRRIVEMPARVREAVRWILDQPAAFRPQDVGGRLEESAKRVLVGRLLEEGLLIETSLNGHHTQEHAHVRSAESRSER